MRLRSKILLLLLLVITQSGCVMTGQMWQSANETRIASPHLLVEEDAAGRPHYRAVYALNNADGNLYVYDLTPEAIAACTVSYDDVAGPRTPATAERFARIAATQWPATQYRGGMAYATMTALDKTSVAHSLEAIGSGVPPANGVALFVIDDHPAPPRPAKPMPATEPDLRYFKDDNEFVVGPSARYVALPFIRPRPPSDQRRAKTTAALLTPLTGVCDILMAPIIGLVYLLDPPRC